MSGPGVPLGAEQHWGCRTFGDKSDRNRGAQSRAGTGHTVDSLAQGSGKGPRVGGMAAGHLGSVTVPAGAHRNAACRGSVSQRPRLPSALTVAPCAWPCADTLVPS